MPTMISAPVAPYNPNQELEEFKIMRNRAGQQNVAQQQQANDAIKRRFAAQGGLNSGAYMKQQERVGEQLRQEASGREQDINLAESAAKRQLQEAQMQRDFASNEAEKQRGFAGTEAEKARQFQGGQFDKEFGLKSQAFEFEKGTKLRELDLADKQFDMDQFTTGANLIAAMGANRDMSIDRQKSEIAKLLDQMFGGGQAAAPQPTVKFNPRGR